MKYEIIFLKFSTSTRMMKLMILMYVPSFILLISTTSTVHVLVTLYIHGYVHMYTV